MAPVLAFSILLGLTSYSRGERFLENLDFSRTRKSLNHEVSLCWYISATEQICSMKRQ